MEKFQCGSWMVLLLLLLLSSVLNHGMVESRRPSPQEEEDMELERQLKMLNKPAIKTLKMRNGDVVDCVDIYKQPAFDNPLLKDHKIRFDRRFSQFSIRRAESKAESKKPRTHVALERVACPEGTVPIRRINKEELRNHNRIQMHPLADPHSSGNYYGWRANNFGAYRGASVDLSTHSDEYIKPHQFTSSQLMLLDDNTSGSRDGLLGGWFVNPDLYNDTRTRFTIYFLANGRGCFNLLCSGFVQLTPEQYVGSELQIIPGAPDNWIKIDISTDEGKDPAWGLEVTDHHGTTVVGYWPGELFTNFHSNMVARVAAGGNAYTPKTERSPPMGSGDFPSKGKEAAAYVSGICVYRADFKRECLTKDTMDTFSFQTDPDPACYGVGPMQVEEDFAPPHFYYGGPGGCTP